MEALQENIADNEDSMSNKYLTFLVSGEVFGIGIRHVTEIIGIQPISTLPDAPKYIKGIINLRGKIIPVIDMRLKFKKGNLEYTDRTCIIVAELNGRFTGLIVDSVAEVMDIGEGDISAPPDLGNGEGSRYISGIGKVNGDVKLIIELETLLGGNVHIAAASTK